MSWAEEDWTVGLSGRVLQRVKELQIHQERLSRENKQKQLQLDNIQTSLEKQTVKYEEVRGELQSVHRELQSAQEEAKVAVINSQRLSQDLQTKQAQVCSLEGQLDAARTLNNKFTQEVKRLEAELEKLQNSHRLADTTVFSTPCWSATSPWEHNGSRKEERSGQRDEGVHVRQRLQFSDMPTASVPRQQNRSTPQRHPSDQSDSFSTPSSAFPWERDDLRPAAGRRTPSSPQTPVADVISKGQSEQGAFEERNHRTQTDVSLSEMRNRVTSLEEELAAKAETTKSIQNEMAQNKQKLGAAELSLQRARDELSQAHTRMAQQSERTSAAEHRLKQLQEELKCQRQNAESSRLQHQQRTKELEKQHQRDLMELQTEKQCLEKQHQQEVNKLNQELQQARKLHNALQAQADKLSLQKQALDKELDTLKEKLKWTEEQLQDSQKNVAQTQAKLMEAKREAEGVAVSLEQSRKREQALEQEGRRLAEERADALRLLKELQEQKVAPVAPQPGPYCPAGQSFSPQPALPHQSRATNYTSRPATARVEQRREKEVEDKREKITASYPVDREPGEGIDSEHIAVHISTDSECLQREHSRRNDKSRNDTTECDGSGTNGPSSFDPPIYRPPQSPPNNTSMDGENCSLKVSAVSTSSPRPEQATPSDLQRENAMLRSELRDAREELQKRLEDLEAQRRAETEARTRLKQLSRKHTSQAVEKEEQDKEWRAQLEREKAEAEKLRKALGALETEMKRGRSESKSKGREEQEQDGTKKELEDRENEMIQLNIQLKKQLSEVKVQLALEREQREREEEDHNQTINTERDKSTELGMKLAELAAELEELKRRRSEDSLEEEKLSVSNSLLTHQTLHDDELNSNFTGLDNKALPLPEQHLLLCQFTNEHNALVSQTETDLIQEEQTVIDPEHSPLSDEGQTGLLLPGWKDAVPQHCQGGSSSSDRLSDVQKGEFTLSGLTKEVERLQKENARETQRANHYQVKLKALQNQVTGQTKQLTMAFEKQSQHITGLLAEIQVKESTLNSKAEELQRCRQELEQLRAEKEVEETTRRERATVKEAAHKDQTEERREGERRGDETGVPSELESNQEKEFAFPFPSGSLSSDSNAQKDEGQPETVACDAEQPAPVSRAAAVLPEMQHPASGHSEVTPRTHGTACVKEETERSQDGGTARLDAQPPAAQLDNRHLEQRVEAFSVPGASNLAGHAGSESQQDPVKQSQSTTSSALSCSLEHRPLCVPSDVITETQQLVRTERRDGGRDLEEDRRTDKVEGESEAAARLQIHRLQQQVLSLRKKVQAFSQEAQQQAQELAVWRLASQPSPALDQSPSLNHVTLIREDELLLSCSSNRLQGRMMSNRLQQSNQSELSLHPSALQECSQDCVYTDKESEKENQEINSLRQSDAFPTQHKGKRDAEVLQTWPEKASQPRVAKDPHIRAEMAQRHTGSKAEPQVPGEIREANTAAGSSARDVRTQMRSVSCQTEETLHPRRVPTELHCAHTQTEEEEELEEDDEELVESPPVSPAAPPEERGAADKMLFSSTFPIPADPARLAERIRRNRTQLSAAFDDTEYEPYGLPEVVMKGFADIPTGPSCPYIVRRGLLGTAAVPVPQKDAEQETD